MNVDLDNLLRKPMSVCMTALFAVTMSAIPLEDLLPDNKFRAEYTIKRVQNEQQIIVGEVYAPYVIDSHGEMMLPEDVEKLAHGFLIGLKNHNIDLMHNNKAIKASVVESFIARADDPLYQEGAWVLAVKVYDDDIWADIKAGKLNGYSFEAMVYKQKAEVEYDYLPVNIGLTEENDGHDHVFWVEVGEDGRVIGGTTGPGGADDHVHKIRAGTATELCNGDGNYHAHRYFLNEIED